MTLHPSRENALADCEPQAQGGGGRWLRQRSNVFAYVVMRMECPRERHTRSSFDSRACFRRIRPQREEITNLLEGEAEFLLLDG